MNWKTDNDRAVFRSHGWTIDSQLSSPGDGFRFARDSVTQSLTALQLASSPDLPPLWETYTPSDELVARYTQDQQEAISVAARYKISEVSEDRITLQATYAIETRLFESHPWLSVIIPSTDQEPACISQWERDGFKGIVLLENSTLAQSSICNDETGSELSFFRDFLERGVIRKCRMRMIVVRADSDAVIDESAEMKQFEDEPLPLLA